MKAIRLLAVTFFIMAGALLLIGQNQALAQAVEDRLAQALEDKEDIKTDWIMHSIEGEGPDTQVIHDPDSTHWLQILLYAGGGTCWNKYLLYRWTDNGNGYLDRSDIIRMHMYEAFGHPTNVCYEMHVKSVTLTLWLTKGGLRQDHDSLFVEFTGGGDSLATDSLNRALNNPVSTWWHEVWPNYCPYYHLDEVSPPGSLEEGKNIRFGTEWWHVQDIGIDITVDTKRTIPCTDQIPTTTQWGMIVLVVLIVSSGVFIILKRRKAAVPA